MELKLDFDLDLVKFGISIFLGMIIAYFLLSSCFWMRKTGESNLEESKNDNNATNNNDITNDSLLNN